MNRKCLKGSQYIQQNSTKVTLLGRFYFHVGVSGQIWTKNDQAISNKHAELCDTFTAFTHSSLGTA